MQMASLDEERPYLYGNGPVTFSTSLELVPWPVYVWDTNGYYVELGVHFRATKRQLIEAYRARDGQNSTRLTYILGQLLDPEVRRRYDATPMDSVFLDYYVETMLRARRAQEVSNMIARGFQVERAIEYVERGGPEVYEDPFDMWSQIPSDLDNEGSRWETRRGLSQGGATVFPYAFYVWQSEKIDRSRMARWQEALVTVLGGRKEHLELAIGCSGYDPWPWVVERIGYRIVVFLGDDAEPSEALAEQVASHLGSTRESRGALRGARGEN